MHTPGPWKIVDHDEEYITITDVEQMYGICRIEEDASESRRSMTANARLIAAAPELLEALQGLFELIERGDLVRDITRDDDQNWSMKILDFVPRIQKAQLAIAKARGQG